MMKLPAATAILVTILVGAVTNAQSPTTNQDPAIQIVPQEARTSIPGAPTNFTGHAQVEQLFATRDVSRATGGIVTFQPGARSVWHFSGGYVRKRSE
jgi:hypothetical protein